MLVCLFLGARAYPLCCADVNLIRAVHLMCVPCPPRSTLSQEKEEKKVLTLAEKVLDHFADKGVPRLVAEVKGLRERSKDEKVRKSAAQRDKILKSMGISVSGEGTSMKLVSERAIDGLELMDDAPGGSRA